jgi:FtsP/CotA-like multicopper oxidase with cupredoxin domain
MNILLTLLVLLSTSFAKVVRYELTLREENIQIEGKTYKKLTVNHQIPGPVLRFQDGDDAEILVRNEMDKVASIHWHGILIPFDMDGVPYVNQLPIPPKGQKLYKFPIVQKGTYWYHSHVMFHEQDGIIGGLVFEPVKDEGPGFDAEHTVILSDFTHESGEMVHRNLKRDGDYYDIKRHYVQSWLKAFETGTAGAKFQNSLQRMEGMDFADVTYDHFLANGQTLHPIPLEKGQRRIKLRLINGSSSSIFKITSGTGKILVIGNDGTDIEPVETKILPIGTAETYDIIVEIPEGKQVDLRATSIDNSGYSTIRLGEGENMPAPAMPWKVPMGITMGEMMGMPEMGFWKGFWMSYRNEFSDFPREIERKESSYSLPKIETKMEKMDHKRMDPEMMAQGEYSYDQAKAIEPITTKEGQKLLTYNFTLNGNMENYVWSINGTPVGPKSYILIKQGYRIRFVMKNTTMMNHPMHLHGHFFRVMTKNGRFSPLKHTVLVKPLSTTTIEFDAIEEKDWFFHCHLLYHMMDGMSRIVRYEDHPGPKKMEKAREKSREFNFTKEYFLSTKALAQTNYSRLEGKYFNSWTMANYDIESNYDGNAEGELHLARVWTRFLTTYIGGRVESEDYKYQGSPTVGFTWVLPLNLEIDLKYQFNNNLEDIELELENMIQLTSRLQLNLSYSSVRDFYTEFEYRHNKHFSTVMSYHQLYKRAGIGIGLTY